MTPTETNYRTAGGLTVHREVLIVDPEDEVEALLDALDERRGALFSSSYEYPGRYTRWDIGFVDPPLVLEARGRAFRLEALNERGRALLGAVAPVVAALPEAEAVQVGEGLVTGLVARPGRRFEEEERSRQPSVFSVVRAVLDLFASPEDDRLGLHGAFGYDLAFQFEPTTLRHVRPADQRDLVLYLPDEILVVDHQRGRAHRYRYDMTLADGASTIGLPRATASAPYVGDTRGHLSGDWAPGEYATLVEGAKDYFARGDLFEVVPSQMFSESCPEPPSELFRRLKVRNPAPYGFVINLGAAEHDASGDGASEYLVGASPEMYVRVEEDRVETCPIAGTIARGHDPISDAAQIMALLNSDKDASELTMCTDVDRNDKSRVCVPGSVQVIGRRQIEMYSRLIHTVDHVEGRLRPEFDALDAFLTHTWAVTVTGAPKIPAMAFIERNERSPRAWYGGAIGMVGFDGSMNTGLTLRTIRVKDGMAHVRVGATLLYDSDPAAEEEETELKASAFLDVIRHPRPEREAGAVPRAAASVRRALLVDFRDSFVHTLANYFRCAGADVATWRSGGFDPADVASADADLVLLSPGPGRPEEFGMSRVIDAALGAGKAVFGVCLGLQGLVEYFGGRLGQLDYPMHGKSSLVRVQEDAGLVFEGLPKDLAAGRYHSLFAIEEELPSCLRVTARSEDGVVMGIEHETLPVAAVQFHPESIMSLGEGTGLRLVRNVVEGLR
ncbi:MAG: anthranilate synthase component I [Acidimicrobiia bacterium]|nr:anthranilate synthase component I [Acidimicrobiia bacterium]